MSYEVNSGNVQWVSHQVQRALAGGRFNTGEVIIGVSEVLGRAIVATADTPVQGMQCAQVCLDHIVRTLKAGFSAKGYNMDRVDN